MLNEMLDIALVPYEEDRESLEKRVAWGRVRSNGRRLTSISATSAPSWHGAISRPARVAARLRLQKRSRRLAHPSQGGPGEKMLRKRLG
jgi:hypothetical protein